MREIYRITGLPQEARRISNKPFKLTPEGTSKRTTNKAQSEQKKVNNQSCNK